MKFFWVVLLSFHWLFADNNLVQVPDSCVLEKKSPCLLKAKSSVQFVWDERIHIELGRGALVEVRQRGQDTFFDILSGAAQFRSKERYSIFGYEVKSHRPQYVRAGIDSAEILDGQSLDFKVFNLEKTLNTKGRSFVLSQYKFLNKAELVEYLTLFYSTKKAIKFALNDLSKTYQIRLLSESAKQSDLLKKKQDREIASIELAEKRRVAEQIQQEKERKRSRELFFMRTFKQ